MSGAAGVAAARQAIQNAIKASGAIIKIDPDDFSGLMAKMGNALVAEAPAGVFTKVWKYMTSYKGFLFYTQAKDRLSIPNRYEPIRSRKIRLPESY